MPTIDIHSHFFPESWPDFAERFGTHDWPWLKHLGDGEGMVMLGNREFRRIKHSCWDPAVRLEELDRQGVDIQIISATPVLFAYQRPADQALEVARIFNDAALELCSRGNGRLKSALPGAATGHRRVLRRSYAMHEGRTYRCADRQPCGNKESRRSRHYHLSASLCR